MKIAAASLNQTPLAWLNNRKNILDAIAEAKSNKVDLLCLPELCITGYGCEDMFLHQWVATKSIDLVQEILPYSEGIVLTLGLPFYLNKKIYNTICLIENGKILGFQAKQNLPKDGIHYEPRWFDEWPSGQLTTVDFFGNTVPFGDRTYMLNGKKIGFEICEDAWVTDRPACRLVEEKVDIILNPSASHFAMLKSVVREDKVISASKEFNCTYVFANQLGNEAGRVIYDGDAVIAHKGAIAATTALFSFNKFEIAICEIDYVSDTIIASSVSGYHATKENQFVAAVALALFDYLRKSRSKGFVLSLSGGADSSTCLILLSEMIRRGVKALGSSAFLSEINTTLPTNTPQKEIINNLITVAYQGTKNSSDATFESAKALATSINANFLHWSVDSSFVQAQEIIESAIGRKLKWETDDIALQNVQARARSPLIWMLANLQNSLLITTSNRSEGAVGYTTMDGDTSGSLAPIAGVSKPFILHWLKWAETELGYSALSFVNKLRPTAELRPQELDQSDEEDLMPYEILDKIEHLFTIDKLPPIEIYELLLEETDELTAAVYIIKFFELWSRNQWKRERIAPSFHLDDHNLDPRSWLRYPILSGGFIEELELLKTKLRK